MKIKRGFKLRTIANQAVVSGEGIEQINFNKLISLNESAAYVWENVVDIDFDEEVVASLLIKEYKIDKEMAISDSKSLISKWCEIGLIDNE